MTCPVCGKPYPCAHSRQSAAVLLDPQIPAQAEPGLGSGAVLDAQSRADQLYWRQEVISRVQQHRARRRRRFDASMSLELDFPAEAVLAESGSQMQAPQQEEAAAVDQVLRRARPAAPPKIIRFPRHSAIEPRLAVEDLELAEPVRDTPRILDTPEARLEEQPEARQMELLSSFADIRLGEDEADGEGEAGAEGVRPAWHSAGAGIDLPPQPAGLQYRIFSGMIDGAIMLAAGGMFTMIFAALAGSLPLSRPALLYALAAGAALWLLFQYLFLVYARRTPGMSAADLELYNFAGERATLRERVSRALATALSGLSVGLGFAWALVDEDTLGWHDRISGTYLRNSN